LKARKVFLVLGGSMVAAALLVTAATAALLFTAPGHAVLRRLAVSALQRVVHGRVTIGSVGGSLWRGVDVDSVTIQTPEGQPVIRVERVSARFALTDLLRSRFRFTDVEVLRPVVVLEQGVDGKWNVERVFGFAPRAGPPGPRPLVELVGARIVDGTLIVRQHKPRDSVIAREMDGLNADLSRLLLSRPDSTAIVAGVRSLATRVRNPDLVVTRAEGEVVLDGDSLRFAFTHVALPATEASASGAVRWSGGRTRLEAAVTASRFAFGDVRSFVPVPLPGDGGGSISLRLKLPGDGANEFDVTEAVIHTGRSAFTGRGALTLGAHGGASVRGLDAVLEPFDLALIKLYVDTVPVRGLLRGHVVADGPLRNLMVQADVAWTDESVPGAPVNRVSARGRLALGGAEHVVFQAFAVRRADIDLLTLHHFAPPVDLPGRLRAAGVLDGPWRDASFRGTLVHASEDSLASGVRGSLRLGLFDTVRIDADLDVDSLSLDLLRRRYPAIPFTGVLTGRAQVHGPVTALAIDASLRGAAGSFTAKGTVGASDSVVAVALDGTFDSLDIEFAAFDLPPSTLAGYWAADLRVPQADPATATGTAQVVMGPGVVSGVAVIGGVIGLRLAAVRVALDSARLEFEGGTASASGGIGRGSGLPGRAEFSVRADTVAYLEPLVRWLRRRSGDSTAVRLVGGALLSGHLEGTTREWRLELAGSARGVLLGDKGGRGISVTGRLDRRESGYELAASLAADTVQVAALRYAAVGISASGPLDSLALRVTAGFHVGSALRASLTISGDSIERRIRLDSLDLDLPVRSWHLMHTARIAITDSAVRVDTFELRPRPGGALVRASGLLPFSGESRFDLVLDSVPIADLYVLAQRDTTGVNGIMNGTLHIEGRSDNPLIDVRGDVMDGQFGDYRLPLLRIAAHYQGHRLALEGGLWRDSLRMVAVTGSLPIDLALRSVEKRQLPGDISIVAHADSLDMAVLNALTRLVTDMSGRISLDVRVGGTWDQPSLSGDVDVTDGAMRVPALGARYTGIDARFELQNDVMRVVRARVLGAGGGSLVIAGQARFESLVRPVLDLTLTASRFAAFDIRAFGALTASGALALRGPAIGATLTGRLEVDAGSLQFRDLVEKRIVSLDDPEFAALVDTNLARAADLASSVQLVFLDSLRIEALTVALGNDVWLRSSETNIQLDGDFDVWRRFEGGVSRYRLDGTLHAVRGTYRLVLGKENSFLAISRDFRVTRGTVRFFGTPDFNPELDIAAEHVVRAALGPQLTVRVLITGTLLRPELHLESDAQPPMTETEIVSYLMFGQPPASLAQAGVGGQSEAALAQAVGTSLVGGVGQALASELGLSLDYLTIVPGAPRPGSASGLGTARLEAGAQLGERTFLSLNAGLCEVRAAQLVGATLEYRLTGRFTASASFEPVIQECGTSAGLSGLSTRKQFGFDLFWQQGIR
jgi:translocation and assembly module TamB